MNPERGTPNHMRGQEEDSPAFIKARAKAEVHALALLDEPRRQSALLHLADARQNLQKAKALCPTLFTHVNAVLHEIEKVMEVLQQAMLDKAPIKEKR